MLKARNFGHRRSLRPSCKLPAISNSKHRRTAPTERGFCCCKRCCRSKRQDRVCRRGPVSLSLWNCLNAWNCVNVCWRVGDPKIRTCEHECPYFRINIRLVKDLSVRLSSMPDVWQFSVGSRRSWSEVPVWQRSTSLRFYLIGVRRRTAVIANRRWMATVARWRRRPWCWILMKR